jgi:hypothetical protein
MDKKQLANLLREKRAQSHLTGTDVVRQLKDKDGIELSAKTLWGYEAGVSMPPVPVFLALCRIYGIENLADGSGETIVLSGKELKLLELFRAASPEIQELAIKLLDPKR